LARGESKASTADAIEYPLTILDILVQESHSERLRFKYGPKPSLPTAMFAYALADYWKRTNADRQAMEFREIVRSEGSPAFVFKLDDDSVLSYLDHIGEVTDGAIVFQDTALIRRVVKQRESPIDTWGILGTYYGSR